MAEAALVELLSQIILYKGEKKKKKAAYLLGTPLNVLPFFVFFPLLSEAQPSDVKVQAAAFRLSF